MPFWWHSQVVRQGPAKPPSLGSNPSATLSLDFVQFCGSTSERIAGKVEFLPSVKFLLYIVATPIGNLEDISQRALRTLQECDAILCEDTRRTKILLDRYGLKKPLISYHKFNEMQALEKILADLESGKNLALVSDAGTPCINDPGGCALPPHASNGAFPLPRSPAHAALFLPSSCRIQDRKVSIHRISSQKKQQRSSVKASFIPALPLPSRALRGSLTHWPSIEKLDKVRTIAVAREMTKTFEECLRGTASELLSHFLKKPPKGEIVSRHWTGEPPETPPRSRRVRHTPPRNSRPIPQRSHQRGCPSPETAQIRSL